MTAVEPRRSCARCGRPLLAWVPRAAAGALAPEAGGSALNPDQRVAVPGACFCDRITLLPTRTQILLLQHPRERRMGIGTARLAHLALPGSQLRVAVDFAADPVVSAALAGGRPTYVLFPGPQARTVEELRAEQPVNLVVLDGTWSQARKLLSLNPQLAALPRVAFNPSQPSGYLIRRQPAAFCVSTIEALAEVLQVLEPEAGPWGRLLAPFKAMVERQRWFETAVQSRRHLKPLRTTDPRRSRLAERLSALWPRLVCVQGEANAWARNDPRRQDPETIHWLAHRPATGESFESVIAPRRPLAPATHQHVGLPAARIEAGMTAQRWHDDWRRFARPEDVLVTWGDFYRGLATTDGLPLATESIDLRVEVTRALRRRVGTVDDAVTSVQAAPMTLGFDGRGGRRLDALVSLLHGLRWAYPSSAVPKDAPAEGSAAANVLGR